MPSRAQTLSLICLLIAAPAVTGCKSRGPTVVVEAPRRGASPAPPVARTCSTTARAVAPNVTSVMRRSEFWLKKIADADAVVLDGAAIGRLNRRNARRAWAFQDVTKAAIGDHARIDVELQERRAWLQARLDKGRYVEATAGSFAKAARLIDAAERLDELRVLARDTDLRCIPMDDALYQPPVDPAFDRNQCSGLHAGEVLRVLRRTSDGAWLYAHAGHSVGWLRLPKLTPVMTADRARAFRDSTPRLVVTAPRVTLGDGLQLRMGATLPITRRQGDEVVVSIPTIHGVVELRTLPPAGTSAGYLPFTRRQVYERALAYLDHPYGWGERDGGQDCSRLLLDVFSTFGVRLGRHSGEQAKAGTRVVELGGMDEDKRRAALVEAMREGVVFAYMPGHIMLMLGGDGGRAYAVSAISEFKEPCSGGDRTVRVDRVVVSDMEVGRGTTKRSFIERISHLAVFSAEKKNDP